MSDRLALQVLLDRDDFDLPGGSIYAMVYVHRLAYDDGPVLEWVRRDLRRKVTEFAAHEGIHLQPGDVWVADVSPDELDAAWRKHAPMDPPPLANAHALIGYWTPPLHRFFTDPSAGIVSHRTYQAKEE